MTKRWKRKEAHSRTLQSGRKVRVKAHRQRYSKSLTKRQQDMINRTKSELKEIEKRTTSGRGRRALFVARTKAAREILSYREANDLWKDLQKDDPPVGFISDDRSWNNWLNSLGQKGDLINIDSSHVLRGQTVPEPWWNWTRTSKKWKEFSKGALKNLKKKRPDKRYIQKELILGIQIELEHTDDPVIAEIIAKDHLDEFPHYYTHLKRMETNLSR